MSEKLTTEEAVLRIMETEKGKETAYLCYYDFDTQTAYQRFAASEEWDAVKLLLKKFQPPSKLTLDLGAGNSIASYALQKNGYSVISLEPDASELIGYGALRKTRNEICDAINSVSGYGESLPFGNNVFGVVYLRQVLHHATNLEKMVDEIFRVLMPGGIFIACREHVIDGAESLDIFLKNHALHKYTGCENAFLLEEYLAKLNHSGFKLEKLLLSYDSVINHYPKTNELVRSKFLAAMKSKLGIGGLWLSRIPGLERYYRRRLSKYDNGPGRMISFVARK